MNASLARERLMMLRTLLVGSSYSVSRQLLWWRPLGCPRERWSAAKAVKAMPSQRQSRPGWRAAPL